MKRPIFITFSITISMLVVGIAVAQINRAACFRKGVLPRAIDDAQVILGKMIFQNSEDEWRSQGVSEPDLLRAIKLLEVNGPAMNFEHASTRYVTFELAVCPAIEMPITLGLHCGQSANIGWIVGRCQQNRG